MPETAEPKTSPANSIEEVVNRLDAIIDRARRESSRLGYFAALYRTVTVRVRDGIANGEFVDGERIEKLDVLFANRYLTALQQFRHGQQPTRSWLVAFQCAEKWRLLILQHLLLGINAHINLDLGVAAARSSPGDELPGLKEDFFTINKILSDLLDVVQNKINALSPGFGFLDRVGGRTDEAILNFSIERARDEAWNAAKRLANLDHESQEAEIARLDEKIAALARIVENPGWLVRVVAFVIRVFESRNIAKNIGALF